MKKLQPVLIFILVIACVFMYIRKPSGHQQEIERLERDIKKREKLIDSAYHVIQLGNQREIALKLRYSLLQASNRKNEQEANKYLKMYYNERNKKTPILSDVAYDSVLNSLFPR